MFANLAEKARSIKAKDLLREHSRDELIDQDAPLDLAVHQLVHGRLPSLVVMRGDSIVGILRLGDVFKAVTEMINASDVQKEPV
jgi:Mg2+/Co2+ transporter CorB